MPLYNAHINATVINMLVEVAYAQPDHQVIIKVDVDESATVNEAIVLSGILDQFPEIDLDKNKVGIFGKISKLDSDLREKDRVEIYRALIADPKASRKKRAAKKEKVNQGKSRKKRTTNFSPCYPCKQDSSHFYQYSPAGRSQNITSGDAFSFRRHPA